MTGAPRAWLELGDDGASSVDLSDTRVTGGRSGADVEFEDETVSRLHAVIERLSNGWVLHDLGSTNGTTINRSPVIGARVLRDGDHVAFGFSAATFRCSDAAGAPVPTTPRVAAPELT